MRVMRGARSCAQTLPEQAHTTRNTTTRRRVARENFRRLNVQCVDVFGTVHSESVGLMQKYGRVNDAEQILPLHSPRFVTLLSLTVGY
jgi:hypothetical protein